jgi:hypothetical protein
VLDVEGKTPEARRAEVIRDMTSPAATAHDLWLRHLTRAVIWGVMLAVALPGWFVLGLAVFAFTGDRETIAFNVAYAVGGFVTIFIFAMACLHLLKAVVATYVLEDRWNPDGRLSRWLMLAPIPDVLLAGAVAALAMLV